MAPCWPLGPICGAARCRRSPRAARGDGHHFSTEPEEVHDALVLGLRDYLHKCGFAPAVLGLSGGIDSALVACLAADALGPKTSWASPCRLSTSRGSIEDSRLLAGAARDQIPANPTKNAFETVRAQFKEIFAGLPENEAEETCSPGSVAHAHGAFEQTGPPPAVHRQQKRALGRLLHPLWRYVRWPGSHFRRAETARLPHRPVDQPRSGDHPRETLEKPPSAELKPDQRDQDTLPPYEILDPILQLYVEEQLSTAEIIARGFEESVVRWVVRRVGSQ